jgi:hypothetical protein
LKHPNEICTDLFKFSWPRTYGEAKLIVDYLAIKGVTARTAKCLVQSIIFSANKRFASAEAMKSALLSAEGYPITPAEMQEVKK